MFNSYVTKRLIILNIRAYIHVYIKMSSNESQGQEEAA